jgi:hypothetical protein
MQFLVSGEQVDELMAAMYACMQRNTQEKKILREDQPAVRPESD